MNWAAVVAALDTQAALREKSANEFIEAGNAEVATALAMQAGVLSSLAIALNEGIEKQS